MRINGSNEPLQTNAEGTVHFLLQDQPSYQVDINGQAAWSGAASDLKRQIGFVQQGSGGVSPS